MKETTFSYKSSIDGKEIFVYKWSPDTEPKACVQVLHGMAEHAGRYKEFGERLTQAGYVVYANDHRGHGKTAGKPENVGFFDAENGWLKVVNDAVDLTKIIKDENKDKKVFLFGHSMGSLLIRTYIIDHSDLTDGVILSGTSGEAGFLVKAGRFAAKLAGWFKPKNAPAPLLDKMTFGKFEKLVANSKTKFDWLTRDHDIVKKYIEDPYCGGIFSNRFFYDMTTGLLIIHNPANIAKVRKDLPVFFIAGEADPVGSFGLGVKKVYNMFKVAGIEDLNMKLYKDARHEIINEINRDEVYKDIINWFDQKIG